jgi:hypothetical protein
MYRYFKKIKATFRKKRFDQFLENWASLLKNLLIDVKLFFTESKKQIFRRLDKMEKKNLITPKNFAGHL